MVPQRAHPVLQGLAALFACIDRQPPRVLAGGIIGTPDEAAVPPELQAQPPVAAGGAKPRIGAILPSRKEMRAQILIERSDDVADLQIPGLLDRLGELGPEVAHDLAPVQRPAEISSSFSSSPAVNPVST